MARLPEGQSFTPPEYRPVQTDTRPVKPPLYRRPWFQSTVAAGSALVLTGLLTYGQYRSSMQDSEPVAAPKAPESSYVVPPPPTYDYTKPGPPTADEVELAAFSDEFIPRLRERGLALGDERYVEFRDQNGGTTGILSAPIEGGAVEAQIVFRQQDGVVQALAGSEFTLAEAYTPLPSGVTPQTAVTELGNILVTSGDGRVLERQEDVGFRLNSVLGINAGQQGVRPEQLRNLPDYTATDTQIVTQPASRPTTRRDVTSFQDHLNSLLAQV